MIQMSGRNRSTINKWWFHMGKDVGAILTTRRRSLFTTSFPLVGDSIRHLVGGVTVRETDPPTPMGTGPLSVQRGAEAAQRADRGSTREQFYPASGHTDA